MAYHHKGETGRGHCRPVLWNQTRHCILQQIPHHQEHIRHEMPALDADHCHEDKNADLEEKRFLHFQPALYLFYPAAFFPVIFTERDL